MMSSGTTERNRRKVMIMNGGVTVAASQYWDRMGIGMTGGQLTWVTVDDAKKQFRKVMRMVLREVELERKGGEK